MLEGDPLSNRDVKLSRSSCLSHTHLTVFLYVVICHIFWKHMLQKLYSVVLNAYVLIAFFYKFLLVFFHLKTQQSLSPIPFIYSSSSLLLNFTVYFTISNHNTFSISSPSDGQPSCLQFLTGIDRPTTNQFVYVISNQ